MHRAGAPMGCGKQWERAGLPRRLRLNESSTQAHSSPTPDGRVAERAVDALAVMAQPGKSGAATLPLASVPLAAAPPCGG